VNPEPIILTPSRRHSSFASLRAEALYNLRRVTSEKTWRADAVLMLSLGTLILFLLASIAPEFVGKRAAELNLELGEWPKVICIYMFHAGTLIMLEVFLKAHRVSWREFIGFHSPGAGRAMWLGIGMGLLVVPVLLGVNWTSSYLLRLMSDQPPDEQGVVIMVKAANPYLRTGLGLSALVWAPLVEESIFRGVLYPAIKQYGHRLIALLFTCLLFAGIHTNLMTFIPLAIFAILLALLYDRTKVLMACILAHSTFNAVNFAMLVNDNRLELFLRHLRERI
jgi:membrane protease YdiL (CAAX protease family)